MFILLTAEAKYQNNGDINRHIKYPYSTSNPQYARGIDKKRV